MVQDWCCSRSKHVHHFCTKDKQNKNKNKEKRHITWAKERAQDLYSIFAKWGWWKRQLQQCMRTWENHHPIHWEETTVLDYGRGQELLVKGALDSHPNDTLRGPLQPRWRTEVSVVTGLLWWGGREGAIITDLWPPVTCILSSAWL